MCVCTCLRASVCVSSVCVSVFIIAHVCVYVSACISVCIVCVCVYRCLCVCDCVCVQDKVFNKGDFVLVRSELSEAEFSGKIVTIQDSEVCVCGCGGVYIYIYMSVCEGVYRCVCPTCFLKCIV